MKKSALFIAVVAALSLASCKKDHTCTCTTTSVDTFAGTSTTTTSTNVTTYVEAKKGDAKKACIGETSNGSYDTGSGILTYSSTSTCELK